MSPIISVSNLSKTYASGLSAVKNVSLEIRRGEIFALLGPNGAGKTTLISIVCGIVNPTQGTVLVDGHDIVSDYRAARSMIGLVPQELTTDAFETPWGAVSFSRGLFGKAPNPAHIEKVLKDLSLWNRKDSRIMAVEAVIGRDPSRFRALLNRCRSVGGSGKHHPRASEKHDPCDSQVQTRFPHSTLLLTSFPPIVQRRIPEIGGARDQGQRCQRTYTPYRLAK